MAKLFKTVSILGVLFMLGSLLSQIPQWYADVFVIDLDTYVN